MLIEVLMGSILFIVGFNHYYLEYSAKKNQKTQSQSALNSSLKKNDTLAISKGFLDNSKEDNLAARKKFLEEWNKNMKATL